MARPVGAAGAAGARDLSFRLFFLYSPRVTVKRGTGTGALPGAAWTAACASARERNMPDVMIPGPAGRLEARYHRGKEPNPPLAVVLHPDPVHGGTMNNKVVYTLFQTFAYLGFSVLRFNFRGVGLSEGRFDRGEGELADAAAALDWLQATYPDSRRVWVSGFSFGAWLAFHLLMRRPEIEGFVAVAPPVNRYDFTFLSPCPSSGLIIQGDADTIVPEEKVTELFEGLALQKNISVDYQRVAGADHFFVDQHEDIARAIIAHVNKRYAVDA